MERQVDLPAPPLASLLLPHAAAGQFPTRTTTTSSCSRAAEAAAAAGQFPTSSSTIASSCSHGSGSGGGGLLCLSPISRSLPAHTQAPECTPVRRLMCPAQARGKIRHVGVTNFDVPRLKEMVDAGANIVSNQVR